MIDAVEALVERHPDKFALLRSPKDVERLRKGGHVLLPLGMENGAPIGDDLKNLQFFYRPRRALHHPRPQRAPTASPIPRTRSNASGTG